MAKTTQVKVTDAGGVVQATQTIDVGAVGAQSLLAPSRHAAMFNETKQPPIRPLIGEDTTIRGG